MFIKRAFITGFAGMMLYTIYDDHRIWNEHMAKYPDKYNQKGK